MSGPKPTEGPRGASTGQKREAAGLFARSWEDLGIVALAIVAVGGSAAVLLEADALSALETAVVLVAIALALVSLFLTVEARRRRVLGYAQLLGSVAETTVDMHRMIARFLRQDVDDRLLDDARNALVDARELQARLGGESPEVVELAEVAAVLQGQFAAPSPIAAVSVPPDPPEATPR